MLQRGTMFVGGAELRRERRPRGGVTLRKYSAMYLALGVARGALDSVIQGDDVARLKHILDITATNSIARALGCSELDLAIVPDEHLSTGEINRIKGWEPIEQMPVARKKGRT